MLRACLNCLAMTLLLESTMRAENQPVSTDPRLKIELFAENPSVVTPTGIDVDELGRVWVIESNTHFPPEGYQGHPTDRVLVFTDHDHDGKAETPNVFLDGLRHTMSIAVRPAWMPTIALSETAQPPAASHTQVFIATRRDLRLVEDLDGDGQADRQTVLLRLETQGDYPHNGLAGLAFDAFDHVYLGFGENLGEHYTLVGRDGRQLTGGGEGGNIYRFRPDGTELERWSTGYWNPHASSIDATGHLFTVDNDPDSRPPCRLLHSVRGADFGYKFSIGRKGLHPFTSWNGEVAGKLPMTAGTGEAPSGIIAYESAGLPEEYIGDLLCGSWGDHRIDRFHLNPKGASFESVSEPVIVGGEHFRPVGLAVSPDGSVFLSDWVLGDYKVHGRGRLWRISNIDSAAHQPLDLASLRTLTDQHLLLSRIQSPHLVERRIAARRLSELSIRPLIQLSQDQKASLRSRYEAVAALIPHRGLDHERQLTQYTLAREAPYDAVQTLLLDHYGQVPTISQLRGILSQPQRNDPHYVLGAMRSLTPLIRSFGSNQSPAVVTLLNEVASDPDPFVFAELVSLLSETLNAELIHTTLSSKAACEPRLRQALVLAAERALIHTGAFPSQHQSPDPDRQKANHNVTHAFAPIARLGLADHDVGVRRSTVQAVAELQLTMLKPEVERTLSMEPMSEELFLATLAALEILDGKSPQEFDKTPAAKYVIPLLKSNLHQTGVAIQAIRLAQPIDSPEVVQRLVEVATGTQELSVRQEALRTLALAMVPEAVPTMKVIASDRQADISQRQWAYLGLANDSSIETGWWLAQLDQATDSQLREMILYSLKSRTDEMAVQQVFAAISPAPSPVTKTEWAEAAKSANQNDTGSIERGRIVFSHPNGPGCIKCHRIEGRGGLIGPDLSRIGSAFSVEKLVHSILDPSQEISPQYTNWLMTTPAGVVHTGMIVFENEGKTILGNASGKIIELPTLEVETRIPQKTSVMPEKLVERMTKQEWVDLLGYLKSRK